MDCAARKKVGTGGGRGHRVVHCFIAKRGAPCSRSSCGHRRCRFPIPASVSSRFTARHAGSRRAAHSRLARVSREERIRLVPEPGASPRACLSVQCHPLDPAVCRRRLRRAHSRAARGCETLSPRFTATGGIACGRTGLGHRRSLMRARAPPPAPTDLIRRGHGGRGPAESSCDTRPLD